MSKLIKHVEGYVEEKTGLLSCVMLRSSGKTAEKHWFEYRSSVLSSVTRVEWASGQEIVLFPFEVTKSLLLRNYAVVPTPAQVSAYNAAVAATLIPAQPVAPVPAPVPVPVPEPEPVVIAPVVPELVAPEPDIVPTPEIIPIPEVTAPFSLEQPTLVDAVAAAPEVLETKPVARHEKKR